MRPSLSQQTGSSNTPSRLHIERGDVASLSHATSGAISQRHATSMSNIVFVIILCTSHFCVTSSADPTPAPVPEPLVTSTTVTSLQHIAEDGGCPVRFSESGNHSRSRHSPGGTCTCNMVLREINCFGLDDVPRFIDYPRRVPQLTWNAVYMPHQTISELRPAAFGRLRTTRLVLNDNPIGDGIIAARAFAGLESVLSELQLGSCRIQNLPSELLAGMNRLERLHLWGNRIRQLPVGFFRKAQNLRELLLWENEITVLDGDTLAGLWTLQRLDLDRNNIKDLNMDAFRHLLELKSLHLANNKIESLPEKPFGYMTNLRALSLAGNRISYIHHRAFDGLGNLLSLALNDNMISLLSDDVFQPLFNLTQLLLHNNAVDYIWPRTFKGLDSLSRLQLGGNRLSNLPDGALRHLPALRHLDLDGNHLKTLDRCSLLPPSRRSTSMTQLTKGPAVSGSGGAGSQLHVSHQASNVARSRLRYLSLVGNPVICDCQLAWIADFQKQVSSKRDSRTWPTVRGTCSESRSASGTHGHRLHPSRESAPATHWSPHSAVSSVSRVSSSSSSLDAEPHHHHHHLVEHRAFSIVERCSQLAASCAEESLQKLKDCRYEEPNPFNDTYTA